MDEETKVLVATIKELIELIDMQRDWSNSDIAWPIYKNAKKVVRKIEGETFSESDANSYHTELTEEPDVFDIFETGSYEKVATVFGNANKQLISAMLSVHASTYATNLKNTEEVHQ